MGTRVEDSGVRALPFQGNDIEGDLRRKDESMMAAFQRDSAPSTGAPLNTSAEYPGMNAAGLHAAEWSGVAPPAIPDNGPTTSGMTAPGGSAIADTKSDDFVDQRNNAIWTSGTTKTSAKGNETIWDFFPIYSAPHGNAMTPQIAQTIGKEVPVWSISVDQGHNSTTEAPRDILGWRALNVKFAAKAAEAQDKAARGISTERILRPGTQLFLERFKSTVKLTGVLTEVKRAYEVFGAGGEESNALMAECIVKGNALVVGIWGTPSCDPKVGDRVGWRGVCRHVGVEEEEVRRQEEGTLHKLELTEEQAKSRYWRIEPVILNSTGGMRSCMYNGHDWKGCWGGIGTIKNLRGGYSYKDSHSLLQTWLYSNNQSDVLLAMRSLAKIEIIFGVF